MQIDWNFQQYDGEFKKAGMARLKKAADAIRDIAKQKCKIGTISRPARKSIVYEGKLVPDLKKSGWTAREIGAMRNTIRTVESRDPDKADNVRIYAGTEDVFYAVQMEYGRGGWKGGRKSFMRPALAAAEGKVRSIIEGG